MKRFDWRLAALLPLAALAPAVAEEISAAPHDWRFGYCTYNIAGYCPLDMLWNMPWYFQIPLAYVVVVGFMRAVRLVAAFVSGGKK